MPIERRLWLGSLDCSGKDVDVSANEIDPAKRFKSIAVQQVFETDHYFFILYVFKNEGFVGLYDKQKKRLFECDYKR